MLDHSTGTGIAALRCRRFGPNLITSFGEDADGELYVTTEADSVFKSVVKQGLGA
jgi:hypothetical protein